MFTTTTIKGTIARKIQIKWLLENCIFLGLPNVKGQRQTITLRKVLQREMEFFKDGMLKGNQKSLSERG